MFFYLLFKGVGGGGVNQKEVQMWIFPIKASNYKAGFFIFLQDLKKLGEKLRTKKYFQHLQLLLSKLKGHSRYTAQYTPYISRFAFQIQNLN